MVIFYYLAVKGYGLIIFFAALFNSKARNWVSGRAGWHSTLAKTLKDVDRKKIHFHCPSLGEFEQGRPVLEALRKAYPDHYILLTFFSPSGYNIRKNEPLADHVCYLPLDGPFNAYRFMSLVKPEIAFFIKYDFWHFFIRTYKTHNIPVIFISSTFRPSQIYFKWYGKFFRKILKRVNHFFVQDQESLELLYKFAIPQVTVSGDTRFDRVHNNMKSAIELPVIADFKGNSKLLVAGSTWPEDEKHVHELFTDIDDSWKLIIAPHEVNQHRIKKIISLFRNNCILYSQGNTDQGNKKVMIIDNIGLLSSVYRYSDLAYIGGGFGKGIHNILEAAVFKVPVIFGPKYSKFKEAKELLKLGGAFTIRSDKDLKSVFDILNSDQEAYSKASESSRNFVENKRGATGIVLEYLSLNFNL